MARIAYPIFKLIQENPREAQQEIRRIYVTVGGSITDAAKIVGCGRRTFLLWARRAGIEQELKRLEAMMKERDLHHQKLGGRPPFKPFPVLPERPLPKRLAP